MIIIYHNSRCSKSRDSIIFLENLKLPFEINYYLEKNLTKSELENILKKLNIPPIELVRKKEKLWIAEFKNKELTNNEIVETLIINPKLIERPIVILGNKAVIARPTEIINELF